MQTECLIEIQIFLDRKNAKKYFMKKDATTGFIKSFLLFGIAFVLVVATTPIGFLYALLRQLFFGKARTLQIYFIEVALALDNAGNVIMQHLLNDTLLLKKQHTYHFGNKKETISSVIGKNHLTNTLSPLGKALNAFLNFIDKDHSFNSIIYDVKAYLEQ
jgi:8-oxo-dGTP diphosphatase